MKKLVILIAVIVIGLFAYPYLIADKPEVGTELEDLEDRFEAARRQLSTAGRGAALTGVDTTSHAEAARREIAAVAASLRELKRRTDSESEKREIERLETAVREFETQIR